MKEKEKLIEELKQFPMLAQITDADMEDLLLLLRKEAGLLKKTNSETACTFFWKDRWMF